MFKEPIVLRVVSIDAQGRPVCRVVGTGDNGPLFAVLPGVTAIDPRDRKPLPAPGKAAIPPSPPLDAQFALPLTANYLAGRTIELPTMRPGDVVRATAFLGWADAVGNADAVHLIDGADILGRSDDDAGAILIVHAGEPDDVVLAGFTQAAYDAVDTIEEAALLSRKRLEPDKALVVVWREEGEALDGEILASSGEKFYSAVVACGPSLEMIAEPDRPGLFALRNCETVESTDWESGLVDGWYIGGDYVAITLEEAVAEFGFSDVQTLQKKIDDAYPYVNDGDVLAALHFPEGVVTAEPASHAGA